MGVPQEPAKEVQETLSTVSVSTLKEDQAQLMNDGNYLLTCNICGHSHESETDASDILACGHTYLEKKDSTHKKKFANKMEQMVFRMKAVMQGHDDKDNKKLVDAYYESNDVFMQKYPCTAATKPVSKTWVCSS